MFLESGVIADLEPTERGSPQGGVISPLLGNIYLDAFDQFMRARGHCIVRYTDNSGIQGEQSRCAKRQGWGAAGGFLEGRLRLKVNRYKTRTTILAQGISRLGVEIFPQHISIQEKKRRAFKRRVKSCTRRSTPVNLEKIIRDLNPVLH